MRETIALAAVALALIVLPLAPQIVFTDYAVLQGISFQKQELLTGKNLADIYFKFKDKPAAFFHTRHKDVIRIDFYNTELGVGPFPEINEPPFKKRKITVIKENLQQIDELPANVTQVVRVELFVHKRVSLDYTVHDESNLFVFSGVWSGDAKVAGRLTERRNFIPYIVAAVVITGAAVLIYTLVSDDGPEDDDIHTVE